MDLTDIRELYREREKYIGKEVTVGGWIRSIRDSKTFGFIVVNDGTFFEPLQIVYSDKLDNFEIGIVCSHTVPGPSRVVKNSPSPPNTIFFIPFTVSMFSFTSLVIAAT